MIPSPTLESLKSQGIYARADELWPGEYRVRAYGNGLSIDIRRPTHEAAVAVLVGMVETIHTQENEHALGTGNDRNLHGH